MEKFEQKINGVLSKTGIPFVDYGIINSEGMSVEGFFRNSEFSEIPPNRNQIFRMASMTKPITAYLTLVILNDNAIDLHESVGTYVPEINNLKVAYKEGDTIKYKNNDAPITFHHLLSCTSGHAYEQHDPIISELLSKKEVAPMKIGDDAFMIAPLVFEPGSQWGYGISYGWLGKAIESITGTSLEVNLKKYLCYPLNLENTSFNPNISSKARLARVYFMDAEGNYSDVGSKITLGYNPFHYGGGGITSTLSDYLKILQFFLRNMKSASTPNIISLMFKNQIGRFKIPPFKSYNQSLAVDYDIYPNVEKCWGYGLLINNESIGNKRAAGSGSWAGVFNTYFWIDHKNDLAGVFLTQILPCYSPRLLKAFDSFEILSYQQLKTAS
ncbi:beta-lactamase family protein [Paracoccaceae bacterium]|nr:beta-lactamase family protein [Paracoccaceae bacterium]